MNTLPSSENRLPACDFSERNNVAPRINTLKIEGSDVYINDRFHGKKITMTETELVYITPLGKQKTISFILVP